MPLLSVLKWSVLADGACMRQQPRRAASSGIDMAGHVHLQPAASQPAEPIFCASELDGEHDSSLQQTKTIMDLSRQEYPTLLVCCAGVISPSFGVA